MASKKKRLTITLSSDLLKSIDGLIDKKTLRNRSHAIETLLQKSIGFSVNKAVVLAGGSKKTKCVSCRKINGQLLLQYQFDLLKKVGITDVVLCAGKFEKSLKRVFGDGSEYGMNLAYVSETASLGTAGAVLAAREHIGNQRFIVLHGDVLTNLEFSELIDFHSGEDSAFTIAVKPRLAERKFGKVMIRGNKIVEFISEEGNRGISIVNAGVYLFEPEIFDLIPKKTPCFFEKDVFPNLARKRQLSAYLFQGKWYEISRYKDYLHAKKRWAELYK